MQIAATTTATEGRNGIIRWYDPVTGRWLSNDPIGISGGLNQYVFCANDPVNNRDPLGLCDEWHKERMDAIDAQQSQLGPIFKYLTEPYFDILRSGFETIHELKKSGVTHEEALTVGAIAGTAKAVSHDALVYASALAIVDGVFIGLYGTEIKLGPDIRVAPLGNRTGDPLGRYPHYHRRVLGPNGITRPGQGIGRHRPWEVRPSDTSFRDRF